MCLFSLVIAIFNDDNASQGEQGLWFIFYSSPFEIEARQRTLPERVAEQKETNWSLFNPFLPKIIEKQYESKNNDGNIQIIGSDINGMFMYLRSPQIRHKVFHPVFLMMKFRDSISLYYNKNLVNIQEGDNIFAKLQRRIFEILWNYQKLVFLNESKLFILILKRKDYTVAFSKNEKQIIKHLKSLNGPIVNFMITDQKNIPKNFTEMIYEETFTEEYRKGFLQMSFIDFKRTKMDESEKNLLKEFDAVTKQNYDYNNDQNYINNKKTNQQNFAQTTISINHKYCFNRSERKLIKCNQKDNQYDQPQTYFSKEFQQNENTGENNKRSLSQMMDQPKEQLNINDVKQQIEQMRKNLKINDDINKKNHNCFSQNLNQQELNDDYNKYDSDNPKSNGSQSDSDKQKNKDISSDSDKTQNKQIKNDSDLSKINEIQSDSDRTRMDEQQSDNDQVKHKQNKLSVQEIFENQEENKKNVILDIEIIQQNISQKIEINQQSLKIISQNEQEYKIEPNKQEQFQLSSMQMPYLNSQLIQQLNNFIPVVQQLQQQYQQQLQQQYQEYNQQQQLQQEQKSHEKQQQYSQQQLQTQQNYQNPQQQKQYQDNEDKQNKDDIDKQNNEPIVLKMGIPQLYLFNNQGTNNNQQKYFIYPNQSDNFGNMQYFFQNQMQLQQMQNDMYYQNVIQKQQQLIMDQQKIIDEQDMKKK